MPTSYEFDVFISYSHKDFDWVNNVLLPALESAGISTIIDHRDFAIGVSSIENITHAVNNSRATILVLTPNWVASEWTAFESILVHSSNPSGSQQRTLPLLLEKCSVPPRLAILTYLDVTANVTVQLARLTDTISKLK